MQIPEDLNQTKLDECWNNTRSPLIVAKTELCLSFFKRNAAGTTEPELRFQVRPR